MVTYLQGDATYPKEPGYKIIAHVCNDIGAWGRGFVLAISRRWSAPEKAYREAFKRSKLALGAAQFVQIDGELEVANMVAMRGIYNSCSNPEPLQYDSLDKCLDKLYIAAKEREATVHMPKIGSALAKGNWELIEEMIIRKSSAYQVETFIYSL